MIHIELKPCCLECDFPDIDIDATNLLFVDGKKRNCTIYCNHTEICKTFIESEEDFIDKLRKY